MIATRVFTQADQLAFSEASGDLNPMHMDAAAARRTPAGEPVVHGMHAFLWAVENLLPGAPKNSLSAARVQFKKFVLLGRPVQLRLVRRDENEMKAELLVEDLQAVQISVRFGGSADESPEPLAGELHRLSGVHVGSLPDELDLPSMQGREGWLVDGNTASLQTMFPASVAALGIDKVAAFAQMSALVGMVCPGLHSIFSGFTVKRSVAPSPRAGLGFRCLRVDERFRLVTIAVAGAGLGGEVSAFMRPPPATGPSIRDVMGLVDPTEFAGQTALIVGGSRGLGAVTARLLAAGGAQVVITHATGRADAQAVADDIASVRGSGACEVLPLDLRAPPGPQLSGRLATLDHLYYFASPRIHRQKSGIFLTSLFEEFAQVYVGRFKEVLRCVRPLARGRLDIFYPSSTFVEERPKEFEEYATAKLAGEKLCQALQLGDASLRIHVERLPRVQTDQNASVVPLAAEDPAAVMLPFIRSMSER